MNSEQNINLRKLIIAVSLFIIIVVFLQWFWGYLHTGRILISTSSSNSSISLKGVNDDDDSGAAPTYIKATGQLSASVHAGQYLATVSNNGMSASQLVKVTFGRTSKYIINLNSTLVSQPVISVTAQNIAASTNRLIYLNTNTNNINTVDTNNNLSVIAPTNSFQTLKWANTNYGVGQDNNQQLYSINGNTISAINFPYDSGGQTVNYDVSSSNELYVSSGKNIYADVNNIFEKIFTTPTSDLTLGASSGKVAVAYSEVANSANDDDVELAIVNDSGKSIVTDANDSISHLIWSPNNQLLASLGESSIVIRNSSLKVLATIPTTLPVGNLSWLSNNTFVYSESDNIWSFNLNTNRANQIASGPIDSSISSMYVSDDKSYIYYAAQSSISSSDSGIFRISLNNQQAPAIVYQLQDILPQTLSDSTISLINFAQPPSISITPLFPQSNVNPTALTQEAQSQLQQDGFDISNLTFNVFQPN